jgi:hypothetical protein
MKKIFPRVPPPPPKKKVINTVFGFRYVPGAGAGLNLELP